MPARRSRRSSAPASSGCSGGSEQRDGRTTKVPYAAAHAGQRASSTDPGTWASYEAAVQAAASTKDISGIGYVFSPTDPFTGVDLDHCVDPESYELHPAATAILDELDSYWEWSQSRTGVHSIVEGELHGDRHKTTVTPWGGAIEVYSEGRFFVMTGIGEGEIREAQAELDALYARMFPASSNGAGPSSEDPPPTRPPGRSRSCWTNSPS